MKDLENILKYKFEAWNRTPWEEENKGERGSIAVDAKEQGAAESSKGENGFKEDAEEKVG